MRSLGSSVCAAGLALVLAGCAAQPAAPEAPRPECAQDPDKTPVDGGFGGTGNAPETCEPPAQT